MAKWFRRKTLGYGWAPCTWQGWMVMALFTAAVAAAAAGARQLGPDRTVAAIGMLVIGLFVVTAFTSGRDSDD